MQRSVDRCAPQARRSGCLSSSAMPQVMEQCPTSWPTRLRPVYRSRSGPRPRLRCPRRRSPSAYPHHRALPILHDDAAATFVHAPRTLPAPSGPIPLSTTASRRGPYTSANEAIIGSTDGMQPLATASCARRNAAPPSDSFTAFRCASPGAIIIRPGRLRIRSTATSQGRLASKAICIAKYGINDSCRCCVMTIGRRNSAGSSRNTWLSGCRRSRHRPRRCHSLRSSTRAPQSHYRRTRVAQRRIFHRQRNRSGLSLDERSDASVAGRFQRGLEERLHPARTVDLQQAYRLRCDRHRLTRKQRVRINQLDLFARINTTLAIGPTPRAGAILAYRRAARRSRSPRRSHRPSCYPRRSTGAPRRRAACPDRR
jgi:hypothetical protein